VDEVVEEEEGDSDELDDSGLDGVAVQSRQRNNKVNRLATKRLNAAGEYTTRLEHDDFKLESSDDRGTDGAGTGYEIFEGDVVIGWNLSSYQYLHV
jgi:hypothetical protein